MGPGGGAIGAGEPPPAAHPASMSAGTSTPALDPTLTSAPALAPTLARTPAALLAPHDVSIIRTHD